MTRIEAYKNALVVELEVKPVIAADLFSWLVEGEVPYHLQQWAKGLTNQIEEKFTEPLTR